MIPWIFLKYSLKYVKVLLKELQQSLILNRKFYCEPLSKLSYPLPTELKLYTSTSTPGTVIAHYEVHTYL